jgi:hypothetical protein
MSGIERLDYGRKQDEFSHVYHVAWPALVLSRTSRLPLYPPSSIMTAQVDHKTLRRLCLSLVQALHNSDCIFIQIGLINDVMDEGARFWESDPVTRRIMDATYNASFKWLTRARSDDELLELRNATCQCTQTPPYSQARHHERGRQTLATSRSLLDAPWTAVITWVLLPFGREPPAVNSDVDVRELHLLSRRTAWPRSITSMLPHGPERTVHALLRLFEKITTPSERRDLYSALERITKLCHPLVARLLVRSSMLFSYAIGGILSLRIPAKSGSDDAALVPLNVTIVSAVQTFMRMMMDYMFVSFNETESLAFEGRGPEMLLQAYLRGFYICDSAIALADLPSYRHSFKVWGLSTSNIQDVGFGLLTLSAKLFDDYPSVRETKTHAITKESILQRTTFNRPHLSSSFLVWKRIKGVMHNLEIRQRCTAPGCIKTRADGRLRQCAQCKRVPYCSRACQKAAWAHAIAHRDVCKSIAVLCDVYQIPERGVYEFRAQPNGPGDTASYEEIGIRVLNHFTQLTEYNMAIPSSKCSDTSAARC